MEAYARPRGIREGTFFNLFEPVEQEHHWDKRCSMARAHDVSGGCSSGILKILYDGYSD